MDSFYRVIPTTPRVKEGNELLTTSPTKGIGISLLALTFVLMKSSRTLFLSKKNIVELCMSNISQDFVDWESYDVPSISSVNS